MHDTWGTLLAKIFMNAIIWPVCFVAAINVLFHPVALSFTSWAAAWALMAVGRSIVHHN